MEILRRYLCRLFFRGLPKILSFSTRLPKQALHSFKHVHPPPMIESPELPVEMLMEIFALLEIPDLLRAGSVCSMWHAAYKSLRNTASYSKRPQTPCLLYISESDSDADDNVACIYNLAEERVYRLTLPDPPIRSRSLLGSSNGWLVTADERSDLHIVNPITGEQIALPPVATMEQVKPILDDAGVVQEYELSHFSRDKDYLECDPTIHALHELRDHIYVKAFVFSDDGDGDASTGSYIVVLIHKPYELSFARVGDSKWKWLPAAATYDDCIYADGILYAVTGSCGIDAFDLTGPTNLRKKVLKKTRCYIYEPIYITQTPSGDLLLVSREQDYLTVPGDDTQEELDPADSVIKETSKITLYKVDMEAKKLVEINRLHGHVLFLGCNQSCCLGAEEYPSLKANHVYLTDNERCISLWKERNFSDICVFNLESNSIEEIEPPECWCSWPSPVWITPNLSMMRSRLSE